MQTQRIIWKNCDYNLPERHVELCDHNLPVSNARLVLSDFEITIYREDNIGLCHYNLPGLSTGSGKL